MGRAVIDVTGSALDVKWELRFLSSYCSKINAKKFDCKEEDPRNEYVESEEAIEIMIQE